MEEQEKNVSASPQRTGIGPEIAPNQLWPTGCARSATRSSGSKSLWDRTASKVSSTNAPLHSAQRSLCES